MKRFLRALIYGGISISRIAPARLHYDRCYWGGWDYYALYLGWFRVIVTQAK